MTTTELSIVDQRRRLRALTDDTAGWGVLVYLERQGDMAVLVPIVPELRGYEVVSASEGNYDIWRREPQRLEKTDLTLRQVSDWIRAATPQDEDEFKANVAKWAEETLDLLGVPRKAAA